MLVLTRRQAGERIAGSEPASQLRVMQQGPWVGLASDAAGGRYLQVRRRGARGQRLAFFNALFGYNEQWSLGDCQPLEASLTHSCSAELLARQSEFALTVCMSLVPAAMAGKEPERPGSQRAALGGPKEVGEEGALLDLSQKLVQGFVNRLARHHNPCRKAFSAWQVHQKESQRKVASAVRSRRCRRMQQIFLAWREKLADEKLYRALRNRVKKFIITVIRRTTLQCFWSWKDRVDQSLRMYARIQDRIRVEEFKRATSSFLHWKHWATVNLADKKTKLAVLKRMRKVSLAISFSGWKQGVINILENRTKLRRAAVRLNSLAQAMSFQQWLYFTRESVRQRFVLQRALNKLMQRGLAAAMSGWYDATKMIAVQRRLVRKSLMRLQQHAMFQAFGLWKDGADALKAEAVDMKRAERAILLMTHRSIHMAFALWQQHVKEKIFRRVLLRRVASRMMHTIKAKAFFQWCAAHTSTAQHRAIVQRALARFSQREVAGAFGRWQEQVLAARDTARAVAKAQKFFLALKNHAAHTAFSGWCEAAQTLAAQRRLVRKSLMRMQQRALSQALWDWVDGVDARRHERFVVQRALGKLMNRLMSASFFAWHDVTSSTRENINALVKGEQFLLGLFNRTLRSAFMQWVAFWEEMNRQRRLVRKSLMRITQRALAECFEDWLVLLERKRAAEETHRRFERAVRYMKNRAVHMSFERWSEYVSGAQMQRKKLRKVVLRLLNIKVAASLQGWADMASTRRLQRARVRKSVSRILHRVSSMAFVKWFDQVEELKHQRTIISRALGKIMMRRRAMAFSAWAEAVEEKRTFHHGVVQTSKFLLALMKRRHRAIFSGWLWQVEELKRLRFLVKKSLGRMLQRQMASAFDTWISAVRHTHTEIASNAKIKGAVAHMMNRALGISFYRWLDSVRTLRSRRGLLSKVIIRMQKKTLAAAFSYWRSFAYEHRVMANKVRKIIGRWQGTTIFTTMRKWRHYVQLLNSRRALIRKVIMRWEHQVQTKALHSWSNAVVLARSRRTLVGKLLARTASRSLQMFFMSWREVARQRVDMQEGHLLYAVPRILAVKKRFAFKIWMRYIRKVRGHRNRAKKMGQELTAHAFTTWRLHASLKVRVLEDTKYQQERETHKQLLDTAYDKVLRECEALEGKVMTLESQRDADFANFEFGKSGIRGRIDSKGTEDTMDILQQLRDENRLLQSEMSSLLDLET